MSARTVLQVVPHPWEDDGEVGAYVRPLSEGLAAAGHRVLVVCPSRHAKDVRAARRSVASGDELGAFGAVTVIPLAEVLAHPPSGDGRGRRASLPIDVTRSLEQLFERGDIDICHVHDPFAPSLPSAALRHSRALNVGTFHAPTERLVATQLARKLVALVFGRLDTRQATTASTGALMARYFPGTYEVALPGADAKKGGNREAGSATVSQPEAGVPAPRPSRLSPICNRVAAAHIRTREEGGSHKFASLFGPF